jgi:hypothetical protein
MRKRYLWSRLWYVTYSTKMEIFAGDMPGRPALAPRVCFTALDQIRCRGWANKRNIRPVHFRAFLARLFHRLFLASSPFLSIFDFFVLPTSRIPFGSALSSGRRVRRDVDDIEHRPLFLRLGVRCDLRAALSTKPF